MLKSYIIFFKASIHYKMHLWGFRAIFKTEGDMQHMGLSSNFQARLMTEEIKNMRLSIIWKIECDLNF